MGVGDRFVYGSGARFVNRGFQRASVHLRVRALLLLLLLTKESTILGCFSRVIVTTHLIYDSGSARKSIPRQVVDYPFP
jgi:hypothetical protein